MRQIVLIAHNIRSAHNVGSLLRTADGLGLNHVYLTGYSPYPTDKNDSRLPHIALKLDRQIDKVALGAQHTIAWSKSEAIEPIITKLKQSSYKIVALEQNPKSLAINAFRAPERLALIVGEEVNGMEDKILNQCDAIVEIPMRGKKESFNVSVAAAIGLSQLTL